MPASPICAVHLVPVSSMTGQVTVDIRALHTDFKHFMFNDWGGASRATNLDGLVVHTSSRDPANLLAYTQVFRTGAVETIRIGGGTIDPSTKAIPSTAISRFYRDAIQMCLEAMPHFGITGPAIAGISLLSVDGYKFALDPLDLLHNNKAADRKHLVLPDHWIDAVEAVIDFDSIARPMLDTLWQAFDIERCLEYTDEGQWRSQ